MTATCHTRGATRIRWTPRPDGLEESVQFTPGYNCPVEGGQGHGVHGMEVRWFLRGPAGAVWLCAFTEWTPGELRPGHGLSPAGYPVALRQYPDGAGLGYHARWPQFEGHVPDRVDCDVIGGPCYGDMSFCGADEPLKRFTAEGEQAIWDVLESAYDHLTVTAREDQPVPRIVIGHDEKGFPCLADDCPQCSATALIINEWNAVECLSCSWREFEPDDPRAADTPPREDQT